MNRRRFRPGRWLAIVLTGGFLLPGPDSAAQGGCVTAQCHATLLKAGTVHPPVESCDSCHESTGAPHPGQGAKAFKLVQAPPDLCYTCHDSFGTKSVVHPPAQEGMCTTCHNPHASDQPRLLVQPIQDLCQSCHSDQTAAKLLHGPVSTGDCTACHAPHASDNARLLLKPQKETCLGCHATVITKTMTTLHRPIREGACTPCHDPHGSQNAKLLVKEFPVSPYAPYTDTEFALCFGCHDRDLVRSPETSIATGFRDGGRNLHYLHVHNERKGRSCALCHELHGSASPRLVADSVPFGAWRLPIRFVKSETGGSCAPGCHRPQAYDRQSPGRKPAAPKPAPVSRGRPRSQG